MPINKPFSLTKAGAWCSSILAIIAVLTLGLGFVDSRHVSAQDFKSFSSVYFQGEVNRYLEQISNIDAQIMVLAVKERNNELTDLEFLQLQGLREQKARLEESLASARAQLNGGAAGDN